MSLTAAMSSQGATTLPPSTAAPGTENQTQVVAQMTQLLQLLQVGVFLFFNFFLNVERI